MNTSRSLFFEKITKIYKYLASTVKERKIVLPLCKKREGISKQCEFKRDVSTDIWEIKL